MDAADALLTAGIGFGAACAGAGLGAWMSYRASLAVMRSERVRVHRERIKSELLPAVDDQLSPARFKFLPPHAAALTRIATIASADDYERSNKVAVLALEASGAYKALDSHRDATREKPMAEEFRTPRPHRSRDRGVVGIATT